MSRTMNLVERANAIIATADAAGRGLTANERTTVRQMIDEAKLHKDVTSLGGRLSNPVGSDPSSARTPGDLFVGSDEYAGLIRDGIPRGFTSPLGEFYSAAGDPVLESTGANADSIAQQVVPGLFDPGLRQERLTLADLFGQGQATGGVIRYMKAVTRNAPADTATAEGASKPGAEFGFDDATESLTKLAAFIPVSEEMLEDAPAVRDYINAHLPLMVEQGLESKLATELYAAAGLTAAPATLGGDAGNGFDALAAGINALQTDDFFEPDALLIHPLDYWRLRTDKDSNDNYYGSGPWAPPSIGPWGLRTVVSQSATQGSPIVGNFREGGTLWRKGGTRLEVSNSHDSFFRLNLLAVRAELRYALTLYFPAAFCVVDITGS